MDVMFQDISYRILLLFRYFNKDSKGDLVGDPEAFNADILCPLVSLCFFVKTAIKVYKILKLSKGLKDPLNNADSSVKKVLTVFS
jgi:hypothetical protein